MALHALIDAILGALADGDIGKHFPPSDPHWRGASSDHFLEIRGRARDASAAAAIAHLDVTIVCEAPRIGPHRDAMRARIAEIAGIAIERVGGQGDHQREARLHRPRRRHRGDGDRDRPPAVVLVATHDRSRRLRDAAATRCSISARRKQLTVATAESCTGGLVAGALTDIAGSSAVVDRGFVTYSNEAKQQMLGVPPTTLETATAR